MRVLWVCSFMPGIVAKIQNKKNNRFGGWIDGALTQILENSTHYIAICYPQSEQNKLIVGKDNHCEYYGIYKSDYDYDPSLVESFKLVLSKYKPDVVHIWGAEFPFFYAMIEAAKNIVPTICSIQGLCGIYSKHFYANLPNRIVVGHSLRDFIKRENLIKKRNDYIIRGKYEKKILENVDYIIGRTDWDNACANLYSKKNNYFKCNETLRNVFYDRANGWSYNKCQKHSIFVSQSSYPIKGFHHVIEATRIIKKEFDDVELFTTGDDPFKLPFYRINNYQKYLMNQIIKYGLNDKVHFLGSLDAQEMCLRYLSSNVFVSASSIENSPNSVGEAMLLGMPVVASYVGGTMNLLVDKREGYLYQSDAPYMLAYYISKVFDDGLHAKEIGKNAYDHASVTHNPKKNFNDLICIYSNVIAGEEMYERNY